MKYMLEIAMFINITCITLLCSFHNHDICTVISLKFKIFINSQNEISILKKNNNNNLKIKSHSKNNAFVSVILRSILLFL